MITATPLAKPVTLDPTIFRTYDIRGIVGEGLTQETVYLLGKALGSLIREQGETTMIIGRDGRHSSPLLAQALAKGAQAVGCDVIDIGMVPTPILYYATHQLADHSGVMVTGSHNPPNYNGLKMVVKGKTLADDAITDLYTRIQEKRFTSGQGHYQSLYLIDDYEQAVTQNVSLARPLKVVIDAGNGVTGAIAPALFRALGCEVHELFCTVDGDFPHHHPDPSDVKNLHDLIRVVREVKADIGLAFDGDGDRLGVVTNEGDIIWPDRLLMLFAKSVLAERPKAQIIFDVKCTHHLATLIRQLGGEPTMWKTGHSLIKAKLAETKAPLAGEMSGHFFFQDRWYGFDDALYSGARLLEIISQQAQTSQALFATIPNSVNTPELKVAVAETKKVALMQQLIAAANFTDPHDISAIDGLRVNFDYGWGLVRPSNTTPCLVLRFEAINETLLEKIQDTFRAWMLSVQPDLDLPF